MDKRKFYGQEELQPMIMIGRRGLIQKRQQNIRNGIKNNNKSMVNSESDADRFFKKLKEHNSNTHKHRKKYQNTYFERYPEKLEKMLQEEQERLKNIKKMQAMNEVSPIENTSAKGKRSMSLGVRNQSFKTSNLTLIKEKRPKFRNLNNNESTGLKSVQKDYSVNDISD